MSYARTTTIDSGSSGDTVVQAVLDLDTDLTAAFAGLNTHEALTTSCHGLTAGMGTIVTADRTQTLTNKTITAPTISAPTITGAVTATGATVSGGTFSAPTISAPTITGAVTASGATITGPTISAPTITGAVTASGATFSLGTISGATITGAIAASGATITSPAITGGSLTNATISGGTIAGYMAYANTRSIVVTETRALDAASGDQSYTGAGFTPTAVVIFAIKDGGTSIRFWSWGMATGASNQGCISQGGVGVTEPDVVYAWEDTGKVQSAVLKTFDADGMTLTWTRTGSTASGTLTLHILYLR